MEYGQKLLNRPGTVLNITAGQAMKDVTFKLTPAGTITGRIMDDQGEPLPGEDTANLDKHWMWSVLDVLKSVGLDVADGVVTSTRCAVVQLAPERAERAG